MAPSDERAVERSKTEGEKNGVFRIAMECAYAPFNWTQTTQANGAVLIHQKMFESRLFFVDKLIDMGAQIILCDPHRATVIGHDHQMRLRATRMTSPDIRAGVALLIAAMSAEGTSTIQNIEQIDRGYKDIDGRLNALGARITRVEE